MRPCQVKGCLSGKRPRFAIVINMVEEGTGKLYGHCALNAIVCEDCKSHVKLHDIISTNNWNEMHQQLCQQKIKAKISYDKSYLDYKELKTVH